MSIRDKNILRVGLLVGLPTDVERHNRISGRIVAIKYDYVIVGIDKKQSFYGVWNKRDTLNALDLVVIDDCLHYVPFFSVKSSRENIESGWWVILEDCLSLDEVVKGLEEELL